MSKIIQKHWTQGGTVVTNFSSDMDIYVEAVREYNSPHLAIGAPSWPHASGAMALHDLSGKHRDLSGFWMLWRCIKAERLPEQQTSEPT